MTTSGAEFPEPSSPRRASVPVEELARRKGVRPVESVDEMAQDVFESDQELQEFLAQVYAAREADLA